MNCPPRTAMDALLILVATLAILPAVCFGTLPSTPRFRVDNGHLYIEGSGNISINALQSVNIQGQDLGTVVKMLQVVGPRLDTINRQDTEPLRRKLDDVKSLVRAIMDRVAHLEAAVGNTTSPRSDGGPPSAFTRRLRTLERRLRTIERLLNTNECASNPCAHGGTCEDGYNAFVCRCPPGWEGHACEEDVDECVRFAGTDLGCRNGGTCVNSPGSYRCICPAHFYGTHCAQNTETCSAGNDLCGGNGICVQMGASSFTCICNQGWRQDTVTAACVVDVDECNESKPPCSHDPPVPCINTPGSFRCGACPPGYVGNGLYCTDIDECMDNNGGCSTSPSVQCINTRGSSVCGPCPPGFQGDGRTCTFQGACQLDNGGCHPQALCINLPGSGQQVTCVCKAGWSGIGVGPRGCAPLSAWGSTNDSVLTGPCASSPCKNGATCTASASSYTCTCTPGFRGRNCDTSDPCSSNPCKNGATCRVRRLPATRRFLSLRTYTCDCADGYTGMTCESKQEACGGFLRSLSGTLRFPHSNNTGEYPHGVNCGWVIATNESLVLNVTFSHFDIEPSPLCSYDWLQIHDGSTSGTHQIGRFCGNKLPNGGTIISTHDTLYLWFRSDSSVTREGFQLHWNSIAPVCGGQIELETHASIASPGSPGKYPANRDCWWDVDAPPGRRIQLHFFSMRIEAHANCSFDYLEVIDGDEQTDPLLARFCNTSTHPAPLVSSGNHLMLHFHSDAFEQDAGFQISAATVEGMPGCGGVFTDPSGTVSPPKDPDDKYRPRLDCGWKIQAPLRERVTIDFTGTFELEPGQMCQFDYIEIHDGPDRRAPLIGKYCGTDRPPHVLSSANTVFIHFHSDPSLEMSGFTFNFEVFCGGVFTEPEGVLTSPYYPNAYPSNRRCVYEIRLPPRTAVALQFLDFDVEHNSADNDCFYDHVTVRDGDNANATLLGTFCGDKGKVPGTPIVSTHNYMYIEFLTDASISMKGFRANYSSIPLECGGILKDRHGLIESPKEGDTGNHPSNARCSWLIIAPPGSVVQLTFITMVLEKGSTCDFDYVAVYDNSTTPGTGGRLGKFCGRTLPPVMTSTDNIMNVVFRTDSSVNAEGFTAMYTFIESSKLCGTMFMAPSGVLTSPNYPGEYPKMKDCTYNIRVSPGRQIRLNFTDFDLESQNSCRFDFLEVRNGGSERSPLVGKYCGTKGPPTFISVTNEVMLRFRSDASEAGRGFRLQWDSATTGCGGALGASSGFIHSPNYPQPYGHNAECYWSVAVAQGSVVRASFVDLELESNYRCLFDFVELWDGFPKVGKLLGRFCTGRPDPIVTKTNHLYVRFHSDAMSSSRGFALEYESTCSSNLTGLRGVIESPNWPNAPPDRANCTWVVTVPEGNKINLTFSHMDMTFALRAPMFRMSSRPNWSTRRPGAPPRISFVNMAQELRQQEEAELATCRNIYVKIQDSAEDETGPGPELGRFCGTTLPPMVASKTNKVFITYNSPIMSRGTGFRLEWNIDGCGGELRRPEGGFTSPNYPREYGPNTICEWIIIADWGSSVQLTIWDFNMEATDLDYLHVYGGPDDTAPSLTKLSHDFKEPLTVTSSSRYMFVRFRSDVSLSGRGFNASYKSVPTRCGGRMTAPFGSLHSPNYPQNYGPADDCVWNIEVAKNHAVRFTLEDLDMDSSINCSSDYLKVVDGPDLDGAELLHKCGNGFRPKDNVTVTSSSNTLTVRMKSDGTRFAKGFKAKYAMTCGARIVTGSSGVIASHDAINRMGDNDNCSWTVIAADPSNRVTLTITQLVVSNIQGEEEGCTDTNNVEVWEGVDETGVLLGRYCANRVPPAIVSRGNAMHIKMVAVNGRFHGWFSAAYSVLSAACGGTFLSERGSFASPGYPDSYPAGSSCEWNVTASPGNRVQMSFPRFDVEESPKCVDDFVEVRKDHALGPLLGVFCGNEPPANITAAHSLWVKFRSDAQGSAPGFLADFALVHSNLELSGPSGQIASPMYPAPYAQAGEFSWRVTVEIGKVVTITVKEISLDKFMGDECLDVFLAIHDGFDDTTPTLFKGCGTDMPAPVTTTSNVVFVHLHNDPIRRPTTFLLEWTEVDRAADTATPSPADANKCTQVLHIPAGGTANVTSPGYPNGYGNNENCTWQFDTEPGWHLAIYFLDVSLEESPVCAMDKVLVYTGEGGGPDWRLAYTVCSPNATYNNSLVTSNFMLVNFMSDWGMNGTGFQATVYSVCGGELFGPSGTITAPNNVTTMSRPPRSEPSCEWVVTAHRSRTLTVTVTSINMAVDGVLDSGHCGMSYLLLKNGGTAASPLLGDGKYCGTRPPDAIPETTTNQLHVKFYSHEPSASFVLRYQEKSNACSREVRLADEKSFELIQSPNFPNIPPPHIECVVVVMAPPGRRVRFDFVGRFDITASMGCKDSAVELGDGAVEAAPLIGSFCTSLVPDTQFSSGRVMRVRYFNDEDVPANGFSANVSIATCGGTLRGTTGSIASTGYPDGYQPSMRCEWRLIVRPTATMTIQFLDMSIRGIIGRCNENNVTVTSIGGAGNSSTEDVDLGVFCGVKIPANLTSLSNEVKVVFRSAASSPTFGMYRGFAIRFTTNPDVCGGTLETASGTIRSPGYPSRIPRQRCVWSIKAPEGRRVSITFRDVDLSPAIFHRYNMQRVWLYLGVDERVPMRALNYTLIPGSTFESTSNTLAIVLYSLTATNNRGFVIDYDTNKPVLCGGKLPYAMDSPLVPPAGNLSAYLCTWSLDAPDSRRTTGLSTAAPRTLTVRVTRLDIGTRLRYPCTKFTSRLQLRQPDNSDIARVCQSVTEPTIILSPFEKNVLEVNRPWYVMAMDFSVEYSWSECGGVLSNPTEITSPGFPGRYPNGTRCAWKLDFEEGTQVVVTFERVDLAANSCEDYLEIHNGDSRNAPKLGPFCKAAEPVHSMGSALWVEFHTGTGAAARGAGFKLTFSTTTRACGGILHGTSGTISSPGFPVGYAHDVECVWEVRVEAGYRVLVDFVDRFNIQGRDDNCTAGDYLEVTDYDESTRRWSEEGRRLCGRNPPVDSGRLQSSGSRYRLTFRSDATGSAEGFKAKWSVVCGFSWTLSASGNSRGEVVSPGFPVGYPPNLNCTYELLAPGQTILARFANFSVEAARACQYDNLTLIRSEGGGSRAWYTPGPKTVHCDKNPPPAEFRVNNKLVFTFQTDRWLGQQGFRLLYELDECGVNITSPTEVRSHGPEDGYTHDAKCTWNVTAPEGHVVRVKFTTLEVEMSYECFSDSVSAYDGPTVTETNLLGRYCGNLTRNLPFVRSTGRHLVLQWQTDATTNARGFVAQIWFSSGACGFVKSAKGTDPERNIHPGSALVVRPGEELTLTATSIAAFQDCDWTLSAPPGHNVMLTVKDDYLLAPCLNYTHRRTACECTFVQVTDGLSQYDENMGRFCSAVPPPVLTSTGRNMWLRMASGDWTSTGKLEMRARAVSSTCGNTSITLDQNHTSVTIRSPGYPRPPPASVRCQWTMDNLLGMAAVLNITTLDLDGPDHCLGKDVSFSHVATGRLDIARGSRSWSQKRNVVVGTAQTIPGTMLMYNIDAFADNTMLFCGKEKPPPISIAPYTGKFQITYHSGDSPAGKGFELTIKGALGCPPADLLEPSGSISLTGEAKNCVARIRAPANNTISLFLDEFSFFNADSDECKDGGLEVLDGAESNSPLLGRFCSRLSGRGFSSTGPAMLLKFWSRELYAFSRIDGYYTTTDRGPGCGGVIHQDAGVFSSPMYPAPYRNASTCRWDLHVPGARSPLIHFKVFDLGPLTSCDTDFVEIYDVDEENRETRIARYCGQDKPAVLRGNTHHVAVKYTTSVRNGGSGWVAEFQGLGSGDFTVT